MGLASASSLHDRLLNPTHSCAFERAIGGSKLWGQRSDGSYDGAWSVCFDQGILTAPGCVVYSFGIGGDWSFDEAMAQGDYFGLSGSFTKGIGCSVHSFDPTMGLAAHVHQPGAVWFQPTGLAGSDGERVEPRGIGWRNGRTDSEMRRPWRVATLRTVMHELQHERLTLLKIDVESFEWEALAAAVADGTLDRVDQILFEAHIGSSWSEQWDAFGGAAALATLVDALESRSFSLFHSTANSFANLTQLGPGQPPIASCLELSWIRTRPPAGAPPYAAHMGRHASSRSSCRAIAADEADGEASDAGDAGDAGSSAAETPSLEAWQQRPWAGRGPLAPPTHALARLEECSPFTVRTYTAVGVSPYVQCLRPYSDVLSTAVRRQGRWPDCDALVPLWRRATADATAATYAVTSGNVTASGTPALPLFVDAGANTGSCSLLMLAIGASTVAFEPLAANLYYFTSAVLRNGPGFGAKLTLHPVALGARRRVSVLYTDANPGNTVVGLPVGDTAEQEAAMRRAGPKQRVPIVTLDEILWPDKTKPAPRIGVLKMDVQGLETQLLHGARRLLQAGAIQHVKFEVASKWLHAQNTSAASLFCFLVQHGFVLAETLTTGAPPQPANLKRFHELDAQPHQIVDFVATRPGSPQVPARRVSPSTTHRRKSAKVGRTWNNRHEAVFDGIYAGKQWGPAGGGSGLGSSIEYAKGAKRVLMQVVRELNVSSVLDAPCGAFVWQTPMVRMLLEQNIVFRYLGVDVARSVIAANSAAHSSLAPRLLFKRMNLVHEPLPRGYQLIFSRDALQHNSLADVFQILRRFAATDAQYLLLGSYPTAVQPGQIGYSPQPVGTNMDIATGDYQRINLEAPPFGLTAWKRYAEETPDEKYLCLYERSTIVAALATQKDGVS